MPTSDVEGKHIALAWYREIRPATVVDVGAGEGTYVKLMRPHHQARWTGVEAWTPYIDRFGLRDLYDDVVVADARTLPCRAFKADLVIAGDVLEHMARDEAQSLLARIRSAAAHLIVSVPVLHLPQDAVNGNPYERHVDHWSAADMTVELVDGLREQWVGRVLAYFWWRRDGAGDNR